MADDDLGIGVEGQSTIASTVPAQTSAPPPLPPKSAPSPPAAQQPSVQQEAVPPKPTPPPPSAAQQPQPQIPGSIPSQAPATSQTNQRPPDKPPAPTVKPPTVQLVPESAAQTYLAKKLEPQLAWFDKKAQRSKLSYYLFYGASFVSTSLIVVANSLHFPTASTILAVVASIATGFSGLTKFQEHWIRYRRTAIALEALKLKYEVGARPFESPTKHGLLIEEAEKIFAQEQSQWETKSTEAAPQTSPTN
jgi:Protein of unknown function (DUF4231)